MSDTEHAYAISVDPGDVFRAISNSRRRQVILSLAQSESALTASEPTAGIVTIEDLVGPFEVTDEQRTYVYVSLVQSHLETLGRAGVIGYDERGRRISPTDTMEPVAGHVRRIATVCYRSDAGRSSES